ncbi:hypothetical protein T439DRAFT_382537 [Meredithblackwellia eburnea MCA 4105]
MYSLSNRQERYNTALQGLGVPQLSRRYPRTPGPLFASAGREFTLLAPGHSHKHRRTSSGLRPPTSTVKDSAQSASDMSQPSEEDKVARRASGFAEYLAQALQTSEDKRVSTGKFSIADVLHFLDDLPVNLAQRFAHQVRINLVNDDRLRYFEGKSEAIAESILSEPRREDPFFLKNKITGLFLGYLRTATYEDFWAWITKLKVIEDNSQTYGLDLFRTLQSCVYAGYLVLGKPAPVSGMVGETPAFHHETSHAHTWVKGLIEAALRRNNESNKIHQSSSIAIECLFQGISKAGYNDDTAIFVFRCFVRVAKESNLRQASPGFAPKSQIDNFLEKLTYFMDSSYNTFTYRLTEGSGVAGGALKEMIRAASELLKEGYNLENGTDYKALEDGLVHALQAVKQECGINGRFVGC